MSLDRTEATSESEVAPPVFEPRAVQRKSSPESDEAYQARCHDRMVQFMAEPSSGRVVQRDGGEQGTAGQVHAAAERGIASSTTSMPHGDVIQAAFGAHDISHVQAHVGGGAADACADMGASAYASGDHVAFARSPDLHTAAHEAAHVVQQRAGVQLYGGVGQSGDAYERHADQVADAVVSGQSAEGALSAGPFGVEPAEGWGPKVRSIAAPTVQMRKDEPTSTPPAGGAGGGSGSSASSGAEGGPGHSPAPAPSAPVAKLHLYADIEAPSMGIDELKNGRVGHTWIALEYIDTATIPDTVPAEHKTLLEGGGKYADPMGFWPDVWGGHGYSQNPFNSYVPGRMLHPDREHQGAEKASQTWMLTQAEVDSVIRYAESKRGAKYSVFFYNCTHFGVEAVKAAGKSAPAATMAGIAMPNALYDGIKARQKKGEGDTMTKNYDGTGEVVNHGADATRKGG